jgi:gliding motility-associated-like protein
MMKKIAFFIILVLFTSKIFSQVLTIDTSTYTPSDLVNKVLINSPCASGTNVQSKNGISFGSTNSIGFFKNSNTSFPFSSGVVITTGDVNKVPGPNTSILSDGNLSWTGDIDLENNLKAQSGITINSVNASFVEFDFQPKTPNFNFSFLFASEEYGTSQCNFSDAFAFLLTDVTASGKSVNLALVPGTNSPVSVATIRDSANNANCPSSNPGFFGAFNGSGFQPAINFNGQTVKMLASATALNTSHTYHIKLVIADGGMNTGYDSAIFLEANSFNIGQNVLGPDLIAANNKAICPITILPTLSAAGLKPGTTFVWQNEGTVIQNETNNMLNLNNILPVIGSGIHNYAVIYTEPGCTAVTDNIQVEIIPLIGVISIVPDIFSCEIGNTINFDLSKNTKIILAGVNQATDATGILDDLPANTLITYYLSNADANNFNSVPLPNSYPILSSQSGTIIFARIQNPANQCFEIKSFALQIVPIPVITNVPNDLFSCANNITDSPIVANFDLKPQINAILGAQNSLYNVLTFHNSLQEAQDNTAPLLVDANSILISSSKRIFARLQVVSNTGCYVITSFNITVNPLPLVDILNNAYVCVSYKLPKLINSGNQYWSQSKGTGVQFQEGDIISKTMDIFIYNPASPCTNESSFKVIVIDPSAFPNGPSSDCKQYIIPSTVIGEYFYKPGGNTVANNPVIPAGTVIDAPGDTVLYFRFENILETPSCLIENKITKTIIPFVDLPDYKNQFGCNSYQLPVDTNGGNYFSATKGDPTRVAIVAGTMISVSQKIFVYKESATTPTNCDSEKSFDVFIGTTNLTYPSSTTACSYTLPDLAVGEYRTAPAGGGNVVSAGTKIAATTTLWFYIPGQNCTNNLSFTITIINPPLPDIPDVGPVCNLYNLPTVPHSGDYYTESGGLGTKLAVGSPIITTQVVYFYDNSGGCPLEKSFTINITSSAKIDAKPTEAVTVCGQSYFLDDLEFGEYYAYPQSSTLPNPILPPGYEINSTRKIYVFAPATDPLKQCPSEYEITVPITKVSKIENQYGCNSFVLPNIIGQGDYYTGAQGTGTKLLPPYTPIVSNTTIYVFINDGNRNSCKDEDVFDVIIFKTPVVASIAPVTRCGSYVLPALVAPVAHYFLQSGGTTVANNIEKFPGDLITASTTVYAYAEVGSPTTKICWDDKPLVITIEENPKVIIPNQTICKDINTGINETIIISSGLLDPKYTFEWNEKTRGVVGTKTSLTTNEPGDYSLTITDNSIFGCVSDPITFLATVYSIPTAVNFDIENWFQEKQNVTVNAVPLAGDGSNFLYALDNGVPQESPVFEDVVYGIHSVIVSDKNYCGQTKEYPLQLVYAPKFFTPNGDGLNETWDVVGIKPFYTKLFVFDRYGQLIKQLMPDSGGWDGFFNGNQMVADDYWFVVTYLEDGNEKEYRSHFSLKR